MATLAHPAVRSRPSRAPAALALVAFAAGVVGLVSAATPEWPDRIKIVQETLDPSAPGVADGLVVAASLALIVLSRGLARRRHRAWQASVALLSLAVVLHIVRGLDVEEAAFDLVVLSLLVLKRKEFDAVGDPHGPPRAGRAAVVVFGALVAYGLSAIYLHAWLRGGAPAPAPALRQVLHGMLGVDVQTPPGRFAHTLTISLAVATLVGAVYVVWLAVRPRDMVRGGDALERRDARRIVERSGCDSLSYFALRRDKAYFFNRRRTAFLAYRAVGGVALVSGDPIGDPDELDELVHDFLVFCHARAWRVAALGVGKGSLGLWTELGLRSAYIGDEAVVVTARFTLEGRPIRKVRQSVTRLRKAGYSSFVVYARDVSPAEWLGIDHVSHAWLRGQPERGFSMALDDMRAPEHGAAVFVLALDAEQEIVGFLHFVPVPGTGDLSLSAMRRLPDTPNGLMEFLLAETFAWGREHGAARVSLNFNAFGELMRSDHLTLWQRAVRSVLAKADRFFQVERLLDFNRKFFPEWVPRYAVFERYADVPLSALVSLTVESLVVWPTAVRRLWPDAAPTR